MCRRIEELAGPAIVRRKGFRTLLVVGLIVLGLGAALWWYRLPVVETDRVTRGLALEVVYATGVVEPVHWAEVTPLVRGRVAEICRYEGERVLKGDLLARLDERDAEAAVAELEAQEDFLEGGAKRQGQLLDRGVTTPQTYERATRLGAIGFDAVKHLVLCRIERRPTKLNLEVYPYLPRAKVRTTDAGAYMNLLSAGQGP